IVTAATIRLIPKLVSVRVQTYDPEIGLAVIWAGLVATRWRGRDAAQQKTAIARLNKAAERVKGKTTERSIPELVSAGLHAHEPKICRAKIYTALVPRRRGE